MKFLRTLIGLLAVGVITNVAGAWVFDATLLNSSYLISQADRGGAFDQFAIALPEALKQSPDKQTRKNADLIGAVITPTYIRQKLSDYLTQLEQYYRNEGQRPKVDFTDLAKVAKRDGFELPPQALEEPIQLGVPIDRQRTDFMFTNIGLIKFGGAGLALGTLALVYAIGQRGKRFLSVAKTLLGSAIGLLPNAAVFHVLPSLVAGPIKGDKQIAPLAPALTTLLESVLRGVAGKFLLAAAIISGLSVAAFALHFAFRAKGPKPSKLKRQRDEGGLVSS